MVRGRLRWFGRFSQFTRFCRISHYGRFDFLRWVHKYLNRCLHYPSFLHPSKASSHQEMQVPHLLSLISRLIQFDYFNVLVTPLSPLCTSFRLGFYPVLFVFLDYLFQYLFTNLQSNPTLYPQYSPLLTSPIRLIFLRFLQFRSLFLSLFDSDRILASLE